MFTDAFVATESPFEPGNLASSVIQCLDRARSAMVLQDLIPVIEELDDFSWFERFVVVGRPEYRVVHGHTPS